MPVDFRDVQIYPTEDESGVVIRHDGHMRFVSYQDLIHLAESDDGVMVR